jgi:hypothetical protein
VKLPSIRAFGPAKAAAVLAVVAAAIFASVLPSSADVSAQSPSQPAVRVQSPAERLARGAALRAEVLVVCPANNYGYLDLKITQRVGPGIASGSAYTSITCTGSLQSVVLSVHAMEHPFRAGTAFASARLSTSSSPGSIYDDREIAIVNP